jgi:hypothetical protein
MRSPRRDIGYRRDAHESTVKRWKPLQNKGFHAPMDCNASMLLIHNQRQSITLDDAMDPTTKSRSARTPTG